MQPLETMHKIAEDNKKEIDDIKTNPQDFIDSCFLEDFKNKIDHSLRTYLERRVVKSVNCGRTCFSENFDLKYYGLVGELFYGERPVGEICVCHDIGSGPRIIFPLDHIWDLLSTQQALLDAAEIQNYVVSLEAIKAAYELWLDAIKRIGFTIVRADNFELSEKEYKKLIRKSLFGFGKVFNVELSF